MNHLDLCTKQLHKIAYNFVLQKLIGTKMAT